MHQITVAFQNSKTRINFTFSRRGLNACEKTPQNKRTMGHIAHLNNCPFIILILNFQMDIFGMVNINYDLLLSIKCVEPSDHFLCYWELHVTCMKRKDAIPARHLLTPRALLFLIWLRCYPLYHILISYLFIISMITVKEELSSLIELFHVNCYQFISWPTINE